LTPLAASHGFSWPAPPALEPPTFVLHGHLVRVVFSRYTDQASGSRIRSLAEGQVSMNITSRSGDTVTASRLLTLLDTEGVAFLSAAHCADLLRTFQSELTIHRHPDSPASPWTVITPNLGGRRGAGLSGFTQAALPPHTDRSLQNVPPAILCFLMIREAVNGGESVLIDTKPILSRYDVESLHSIESDLRLSTRPPGQERRILTLGGRESAIIRYRDDEMARPQAFSPKSKSLLEDFDQAYRDAMRFRLRAGDGYFIHNHRILHGRMAFTGFRLGIRMLFSVNDDSPYAHLNDGFRIDPGRAEDRGVE
jgi:hypothetical protein